MDVGRRIAENIALIGDGASLCASGNQACIGAIPAFVPYPINANPTAIDIIIVFFTGSFARVEIARVPCEK